MSVARTFMAAALGLSLMFQTTAQLQTQVDETEGNFGVGTPAVLLAKYLTFRNRQIQSNKTDLLEIRLGHTKGLSRSFTTTAGAMAIDLSSGQYTLTLDRLRAGDTYSVWLVDRADSQELSDRLYRVDAITASTTSASRSGDLAGKLASDFVIDRVVVASGADSADDVIATGAPSVFQKIFLRRLSVTNESTNTLYFQETVAEPLALSSLVADVALSVELAEKDGTTDEIPEVPEHESGGTMEGAPSGGGSPVPLDVLISQGAKLFFEGTFNGNGRTCGTCHPASNNLTIDVPFINSLPATDPLFVAEFNPALAQLERPLLMRSFGLILENVDGLDDPTNKFVMRGVPHTLGMQQSLTQDPNLPDPPAEMTGWSGDGAPGAGSLRDFAIGAVTQHFTKTLARVPNHDFNLPSEHQLDAMEAFQLSLGRSTDFNLAAISFNDANVDTGRLLFINGTGDPAAGGKCTACHSNGGALVAPGGPNLNFNTNVELVVHPARAVQSFPFDGGFGQTANPDGTFGNRTFNTASVVEAADTPPFFHNNVVETLEGVVGFYSGPEFNGGLPPEFRFSFNPAQTEQLADFMRALNALDNINVARRELAEILALSGNPTKEIQTRLASAAADTDDAIDVLNEGGIFPAAVTQLSSAASFISQAQATSDPSLRTTRIQQAIAQLDAAKSTID